MVIFIDKKKIKMIGINSKKIDELYKEWSGDHHTTNSNKLVHDSSECTDFAEFCLKYASEKHLIL